ncbi:MAG: hypothetical protein QNJ35_08885 [Paracoccaceae bacterium]|nr:hypothetical protein [Paracoccaceae bacterium]
MFKNPLPVPVFRSCRRAPERRTASRPRPIPIRLDASQGDARLIEELGAEFSLRHGVLPIRRCGAVTLLGIADPGLFRASQPAIESRIGPVSTLRMTWRAIESALSTAASCNLAERARTRTPKQDSCRHWSGRRLGAMLSAAFLITVAFLLWRPACCFWRLLAGR